MIAFDDVTFGYDPEVPVLSRVRLELGGGVTLVVGPNGCGKSTLVKLAAGVERPGSGRVRIGGLDLWTDEVAARAKLAYVPDVSDLSPYATLADVLLFVCRLRGEPLERAWDALDEVELGDSARCTIRQLSAGQRRRAVLAAARIGDPELLLLDEPLESMDRCRRDLVLRWVAELDAAGRAVLIVTHEFEPFESIAARVVSVVDGRIVGPVELGPEPRARRALLERLARGEHADAKANGQEP